MIIHTECISFVTVSDCRLTGWVRAVVRIYLQGVAGRATT